MNTMSDTADTTSAKGFASEAALVLFSGGQDSATCLAWALEHFGHVETVGFSYGQRHTIELECADELLQRMGSIRLNWQAKLKGQHRLDLQTLGQISHSAVTRHMPFAVEPGGLPNTFVPGRNLLFLTFAAALAYHRGIRHIITGVCETDYSGYPDCRDDTIKALQVAINLGMDRRFVLHTPLMWLDKAATWRLAEDLGGQGLVELIRDQSLSCYQGERGIKHDWGFGCGECPACKLRAAGWLRYQAATSI
jgi:7-cyano-7-deazaguanine synthase